MNIAIDGRIERRWASRLSRQIQDYRGRVINCGAVSSKGHLFALATLPNDQKLLRVLNERYEAKAIPNVSADTISPLFHDDNLGFGVSTHNINATHAEASKVDTIVGNSHHDEVTASSVTSCANLPYHTRLHEGTNSSTVADLRGFSSSQECNQPDSGAGKPNIRQVGGYSVILYDTRHYSAVEEIIVGCMDSTNAYDILPDTTFSKESASDLSLQSITPYDMKSCDEGRPVESSDQFVNELLGSESLTHRMNSSPEVPPEENFRASRSEDTLLSGISPESTTSSCIANPESPWMCFTQSAAYTQRKAAPNSSQFGIENQPRDFSKASCVFNDDFIRQEDSKEILSSGEPAILPIRNERRLHPSRDFVKPSILNKRPKYFVCDKMEFAVDDRFLCLQSKDAGVKLLDLEAPTLNSQLFVHLEFVENLVEKKELQNFKLLHALEVNSLPEHNLLSMDPSLKRLLLPFDRSGVSAPKNSINSRQVPHEESKRRTSIETSKDALQLSDLVPYGIVECLVGFSGVPPLRYLFLLHKNRVLSILKKNILSADALQLNCTRAGQQKEGLFSFCLFKQDAYAKFKYLQWHKSTKSEDPSSCCNMKDTHLHPSLAVGTQRTEAQKVSSSMVSRDSLQGDAVREKDKFSSHINNGVPIAGEVRGSVASDCLDGSWNSSSAPSDTIPSKHSLQTEKKELIKTADMLFSSYSQTFPQKHQSGHEAVEASLHEIDAVLKRIAPPFETTNADDISRTGSLEYPSSSLLLNQNLSDNKPLNASFDSDSEDRILSQMNSSQSLSGMLNESLSSSMEKTSVKTPDQAKYDLVSAMENKKPGLFNFDDDSCRCKDSDINSKNLLMKQQLPYAPLEENIAKDSNISLLQASMKNLGGFAREEFLLQDQSCFFSSEDAGIQKSTADADHQDHCHPKENPSSFAQLKVPADNESRSPDALVSGIKVCENIGQDLRNSADFMFSEKAGSSLEAPGKDSSSFVFPGGGKSCDPTRLLHNNQRASNNAMPQNDYLGISFEDLPHDEVTKTAVLAAKNAEPAASISSDFKTHGFTTESQLIGASFYKAESLVQPKSKNDFERLLSAKGKKGNIPRRKTSEKSSDSLFTQLQNYPTEIFNQLYMKSAGVMPVIDAEYLERDSLGSFRYLLKDFRNRKNSFLPSLTHHEEAVGFSDEVVENTVVSKLLRIHEVERLLVAVSLPIGFILIVDLHNRILSKIRYGSAGNIFQLLARLDGEMIMGIQHEKIICFKLSYPPSEIWENFWSLEDEHKSFHDTSPTVSALNLLNKDEEDLIKMLLQFELPFGGGVGQVEQYLTACFSADPSLLWIYVSYLQGTFFYEDLAMKWRLAPPSVPPPPPPIPAVLTPKRKWMYTHKEILQMKISAPSFFAFQDDAVLLVIDSYEMSSKTGIVQRLNLNESPLGSFIQVMSVPQSDRILALPAHQKFFVELEHDWVERFDQSYIKSYVHFPPLGTNKENIETEDAWDNEDSEVEESSLTTHEVIMGNSKVDYLPLDTLRNTVGKFAPYHKFWPEKHALRACTNNTEKLKLLKRSLTAKNYTESANSIVPNTLGFGNLLSSPSNIASANTFKNELKVFSTKDHSSDISSSPAFGNSGSIQSWESYVSTESCAHSHCDSAVCMNSQPNILSNSAFFASGSWVNPEKFTDKEGLSLDSSLVPENSFLAPKKAVGSLLIDVVSQEPRSRGLVLKTSEASHVMEEDKAVLGPQDDDEIYAHIKINSTPQSMPPTFLNTSDAMSSNEDFCTDNNSTGSGKERGTKTQLLSSDESNIDGLGYGLVNADFILPAYLMGNGRVSDRMQPLHASSIKLNISEILAQKRKFDESLNCLLAAPHHDGSLEAFKGNLTSMDHFKRSSLTRSNLALQRFFVSENTVTAAMKKIINENVGLSKILRQDAPSSHHQPSIGNFSSILSPETAQTARKISSNLSFLSSFYREYSATAHTGTKLNLTCHKDKLSKVRIVLSNFRAQRAPSLQRLVRNVEQSFKLGTSVALRSFPLTGVSQIWIQQPSSLLSKERPVAENSKIFVHGGLLAPLEAPQDVGYQFGPAAGEPPPTASYVENDWLPTNYLGSCTFDPNRGGLLSSTDTALSGNPYSVISFLPPYRRRRPEIPFDFQVASDFSLFDSYNKTVPQLQYTSGINKFHEKSRVNQLKMAPLQKSLISQSVALEENDYLSSSWRNPENHLPSFANKILSSENLSYLTSEFYLKCVGRQLLAEAHSEIFHDCRSLNPESESALIGKSSLQGSKHLYGQFFTTSEQAAYDELGGANLTGWNFFNEKRKGMGSTLMWTDTSSNKKFHVNKMNLPESTRLQKSGDSLRGDNPEKQVSSFFKIQKIQSHHQDKVPADSIYPVCTMNPKHTRDVSPFIFQAARLAATASNNDVVLYRKLCNRSVAIFKRIPESWYAFYEIEGLDYHLFVWMKRLAAKLRILETLNSKDCLNEVNDLSNRLGNFLMKLVAFFRLKLKANGIQLSASNLKAATTEKAPQQVHVTNAAPLNVTTRDSFSNIEKPSFATLPAKNPRDAPKEHQAASSESHDSDHLSKKRRALSYSPILMGSSEAILECFQNAIKGVLGTSLLRFSRPKQARIMKNINFAYDEPIRKEGSFLDKISRFDVFSLENTVLEETVSRASWAARNENINVGNYSSSIGSADDTRSFPSLSEHHLGSTKLNYEAKTRDKMSSQSFQSKDTNLSISQRESIQALPNPLVQTLPERGGLKGIPGASLHLNPMCSKLPIKHKNIKAITDRLEAGNIPLEKSKHHKKGKSRLRIGIQDGDRVNKDRKNTLMTKNSFATTSKHFKGRRKTDGSDFILMSSNAVESKKISRKNTSLEKGVVSLKPGRVHSKHQPNVRLGQLTSRKLPSNSSEIPLDGGTQMNPLMGASKEGIKNFKIRMKNEQKKAAGADRHSGARTGNSAFIDNKSFSQSSFSSAGFPLINSPDSHDLRRLDVRKQASSDSYVGAAYSRVFDLPETVSAAELLQDGMNTEVEILRHSHFNSEASVSKSAKTLNYNLESFPLMMPLPRKNFSCFLLEKGIAEGS